jgi:hypothetical protein
VKISALLLCVLHALFVSYLVATYVNNPGPLKAGAAVFTALMFAINLADGIRRGP